MNFYLYCLKGWDIYDFINIFVLKKFYVLINDFKGLISSLLFIINEKMFDKNSYDYFFVEVNLCVNLYKYIVFV